MSVELGGGMVTLPYFHNRALSCLVRYPPLSRLCVRNRAETAPVSAQSQIRGGFGASASVFELGRDRP
jgi:hypothetical protein